MSRSTGTPFPTESDDELSEARDTASAYAPYLRAENEDDDGYDPYSDRPPVAEPLFERDPWN